MQNIHDDGRRKVWTPEAIRELGVTTDIETAAAILGIGRTLAFDLLRTGRFPVRVLRLGRRIVVPVAGLLDSLGVGSEIAANPHRRNESRIAMSDVSRREPQPGP